MQKQIEQKACKNCIHYQMCLDSYREGVRQGENLDMSEEEYFADTCGCNFYADNRIYRKQIEGNWFITEYEYFTCSECVHYHYNGCDSTKEAKERLANGEYPNFCPNCGAKMKGGADNGKDV